MPICARCTGVLIGNVVALALLVAGVVLPLQVSAAFLVPIGLDWSVQRFLHVESNNIRRLATGILGGIAVINVYAKGVLQVIPI